MFRSLVGIMVEARAFDVGVYVVIGFFILFILMYIGFEELIFEDQIASDVFEAVDSIFLGIFCIFLFFDAFLIIHFFCGKSMIDF